MVGSRSTHRNGATNALLVLLLGSLSPGLWAQDKLEREIVFVRALAKEMRFIELAKEEAERLATDYRGAGEQDRIAQLAVQVAYYGAKLRSDRSLQRTLFKEALDKSKELAEATADANLQLQARMTLADAAQDFGQFLIEELEFGREAAPDKVKELEEEAFGVFRTGIDACGKVMEHLRPQRKNEGRNTEYLLLWMRKGVLMREQARAVKADRAVLVQRAIDELTEMVLDAGEETAIGLRGLFEIAQCYEVGGDTRQALDQYRTTIGQISKSLDEADELGLSGDVQGLLFEMLQEVSVRAGDVMVSTGAAGTDELFKTFREQMQKHGEKGVELFDVVDPRWGHLMFLAECRFLAESGDKKKAADALAMVLRVNEKHPNDYVGIKAKAVLRDILGLQQGPIPAKYLFEVAKGEFQNKNYEEAIKGLRRTLATMNAEDAVALGLEAWEMLGTAFGLTERYLEATIAMTEGLQKLGNADKDKASDLADALDRAVARLKLQSKNAPEFGPVLAAAAKEITERGGANVGAKLFWKSANDLFNQKKYAAAIAEYAKIPPDFVFHENAQVNIARAHQVQGNFAEARRVLQTFREHVAATKLDPKDPKAQYRGGAVATAEFVDAQMSYAEARGSDEPKIAKDPKKYPEALQKLRGFVTNFAKDGEANLPAALEAIGRLHSDLGELDEAEKAYAQLKARDPLRAARLATEIFREYQTREKTLVDELDQAIAKDRGEAAIATAQGAVTAVRRKLTALGLDYITNSPKPQLAVLVNTMLAFEMLRDWKRVDEIAQKTLSLYESDTTEQTKKVVDLVVRVKIGEALLQQQKFQQAYDMLVAAEKAYPNNWEVKRQIARALGGWFEFDATGRAVKVPGLDRPAEAYVKHFTEYRTWAERPEVKKFSLEWYTFQWECYWFARQAGVKDGKYKDTAAKFFNIARSTDDFATLKSYGEKGLLLFKYFQSNR